MVIESGLFCPCRYLPFNHIIGKRYAFSELRERVNSAFLPDLLRFYMYLQSGRTSPAQSRICTFQTY